MRIAPRYRARLHADRDPGRARDLAVVAVLAYRATAAMTDGEARLAAESEHWRTLDRFFARIESDMRVAVPRGSRHGGAVEPAWWAQAADSAGNTALAFTRAGPDFAVEPGIAGQRIGYRLTATGSRSSIGRNSTTSTMPAPPRTRSWPACGGFRVSQIGAGKTWLPRWPVGGDTGVPRAVHDRTRARRRHGDRSRDRAADEGAARSRTRRGAGAGDADRRASPRRSPSRSPRASSSGRPASHCAASRCRRRRSRKRASSGRGRSCSTTTRAVCGSTISARHGR